MEGTLVRAPAASSRSVAVGAFFKLDDEAGAGDVCVVERTPVFFGCSGEDLDSPAGGTLSLEIKAGTSDKVEAELAVSSSSETVSTAAIVLTSSAVSVTMTGTIGGIFTSADISLNSLLLYPPRGLTATDPLRPHYPILLLRLLLH